MFSKPKPQEDKQSKTAPSIISADMKVVGSVESRGDLQLDGTVEGDVAGRTVTVNAGAVVRGSISADSIRVAGTVKGGVNAKSVTLAATAKVEGDIAHQSLAIEMGATFEGQCRRTAKAERPQLEKAPVTLSAFTPVAAE
jgi:cytoskeletal protein CcmA (bactofilin family)